MERIEHHVPQPLRSVTMGTERIHFPLPYRIPEPAGYETSGIYVLESFPNVFMKDGELCVYYDPKAIERASHGYSS